MDWRMFAFGAIYGSHLVGRFVAAFGGLCSPYCFHAWVSPGLERFV